MALGNGQVKDRQIEKGDEVKSVYITHYVRTVRLVHPVSLALRKEKGQDPTMNLEKMC